MAQLSGSGIDDKFNNPTTGDFKSTGTKYINAQRLRGFVTDVIDSFVNWIDHVIDEDDMASNSDAKVPTQQSARRYTDSFIGIGTTAGINDYTTDMGSPRAILTSGRLYTVLFSATSTGPSTLDIQSSGAKKIFLDTTTQADADDLQAGMPYNLMYRSTLDGGNGGYLMVKGAPGGGVDHFKGVYASEGALASAHPTAEEGDYAFVDTGSVDASLYIWDDTDTQWVESGVTTVVPDATESTKGIAELATQSEVNTGTDDARIVTPLKLKNRDGAVATLSDSSTTDITSDKWTWATSATTRTVTYSFTGDKSEGVITHTGTALAITFPASNLCVVEGIASGDNTAALAGVSGDKYYVSIRKIGSAYYVAIKNFGQ